jgi:hypothetical protein
VFAHGKMPHPAPVRGCDVAFVVDQLSVALGLSPAIVTVAFRTGEALDCDVGELMVVAP